MTDLEKVRQRIVALQQVLGTGDYACSGALFTRTQVCGKPNCRCATDSKLRHGPYFIWAHADRHRIVHHHSLTAEQAQITREAIRHCRAIRRLLAQWDHASAAAILALESRNS